MAASSPPSPGLLIGSSTIGTVHNPPPFLHPWSKAGTCASLAPADSFVVGNRAVLDAWRIWPPAVTTRRLEGPVSSIPCDDCTNVHDAPKSNKASSIAALKADSSACFCWRCFLRSSRRAHLLDMLEIGRGLACSMQQLTGGWCPGGDTVGGGETSPVATR
eukprot:scaffold777_cov101-Alexandrium_tamarense.AAC.2